METKQKVGARDVGSPVRSTLMFRWNELSSHLTNALQCMGRSHEEHCSGPQPEVHIHFGEREMTVHATLLAALSSSWRKHLHAAMHQDGQVVHHIIVDIQVKSELLSTLKSLIYCGSAISSVPSSEVLNVARALDLDHTEFLNSYYSNDLHTICWKGYQDRLTETFQYMCANQLCADISILVDGHIIKAHKLILSACSSVLRDTFQENGRIGIMHLPNIGVMNAQSLITYMYYGEAVVMETHLTGFHKLCSSLEVMSLIEVTKQYVKEEYEAFNKEQADYLKLQAQIKSSLEIVWGRLRQLYDGERKTDLTFLVEKKRLLANKALLSAASPQIHDVLAQELSLKHSLILITDMNYKSIQGLLDMIYNGSCTLPHNFGAVVCSYFDRSLFDIESSGNEFLKEYESNQMLRNKKLKPCIPFLMKQELKEAVTNSFSVIKNELFDTTTAVPAERRKTNCTRKKSRYLQAADGNALSKAHEGTEFQTDGNIEGKEQVIPHWNKSSQEAALTGLKLCIKTHDKASASHSSEINTHDKASASHSSEINTHDKASASHSSEKLNTNVTSSLIRSLRTNACSKCKLEFSSFLFLKEHINTHKSIEHVESLSCTDRSAASNAVVPELGSKPIQKKRSYSSMNCEKVFLSQTSLKLHSSQDHCVEDVPKSCRQCDKEFARAFDMREHVNTHTGDRPYDCGHCEKSFAHRGLMHQHLKTHLKAHKRNHQCSQCMKRFSLKNDLDDHIKVKHSGVVQHDYKCNKCSKGFITSSQLRNHMVRVHVARGAVEYVCKRCKLTYKTEKLLLVHMQSHGLKVKPYKCSSCSADFHHRQSLIIHVGKMHTLEMAFTCSGCGKQFSRSDTMKKHEQKCHQRQSQPVTLERVTEEIAAPATAWSCTHCGQNLSDIEALEQHIKVLHKSTTVLLEEKKKAGQKVQKEGISDQNIVSDSKSCSCPDCGETFPNIASLSTHAAEQDHARVDKSCWICGLCGGAFLEENQLTKHMVMHEEHCGGHLVSSHFQK